VYAAYHKRASFLSIKINVSHNIYDYLDFLYETNINKASRLKYQPIENRTIYKSPESQQKLLEFTGCLNTIRIGWVFFFFFFLFLQNSVMTNEFMDGEERNFFVESSFFENVNFF
jgi:hypothetical protein